jgi:hypothetical protein
VQAGITAEDTGRAFEVGQSHAAEIAGRNRAKAEAYAAAHLSTSQLRRDLSDIAQRGDSAIRTVLRSSAPLPQKINMIVEIVVTAQGSANARAAQQAGNLLDAMQKVLDAEQTETSARRFAEANGAGLETAFRLGNVEQVRTAVQEMVAKLPESPAGQTAAPSETAAQPPKGATTPAAPQSPFTNRSAVDLGFATDAQGTAQSQLTSGTGIPQDVDPQLVSDWYPQVAHQLDISAQASIPASTTGGATPTTPTSAAPNSFNEAVAATVPRNPVTDIASPDSAPPVSAPTAQTPTAGSAPAESISNPSTGNHPGVPVSAAAEAFTASISSTAGTAHAPLPHIAALAEVATSPPLFETAQAVAPPADAAPITPTETTLPVAGSTPTPTVATGMPSAPTGAAAPAASQGPLIAYGADLKPPIAAGPTAPSVAPAAPGSAPMTAASGSGPAGQPAVVRRQRSATAAATAVGLTERALATTATGASIGATAAQRQAGNRLRRMVEAVALQRPELRWGIGDLEAGGTVLVTDLADGWIPPHINIPTGVQLLPPDTRQHDLAALLGQTTLMATYEPGQYLPPAQSVEMSIRARDTATVEDLGWELVQATKWRDGLPRLAHTLARAASARTGCLDSEVALLRDRLDEVARNVLSHYPYQADPVQVGNWQLLATIEALINDEKTSASYHFAWFRALARIPEGHR